MPPIAPSRFARIRLRTAQLALVRSFYSRTLGLPIVAEAPDSVTLAAGRTLLEFIAAGPGSPVYHFAFLIPSGQAEAAREWLATRTRLLRSPDGSLDRFHFEFWDADAVYFRDPAGNIGELIAHRNVGAGAATFGPSSILQIAEIGLPVADVPAAAGTLGRELDLGPYRPGPIAPDAVFAAIGDPMGMFILVKQGRRWWPDEVQAAEIFPVEVEVRGTAGPVELEGGMYRIVPGRA